MNELRARSFMAPIPPAAQTNKELLLDYILRERRVETLPRKEPLLLDAVLPRTDQPRKNWPRCPVEFDPGTNDQKAQLYFDKYGAYPKTQHRICGMRPVEDPNGKISISGKTYRMERFWKEDRVFLEKALPLPDPDRRVAAGQHSAKPQLVIDNHRSDRPNRRSG